MSPRLLEGVAWAAPVVLSLAAGYETLVALEVVGIGSRPGFYRCVKT